MSEFTVSGQFQSRDGAQSFSRTVEAENESVAQEYVFSRFGAEHNLKRAEIDIEEVAQA
ncbi:MAG: 50S ribosomal protein L18Ae [Halolamina sp.]